MSVMQTVNGMDSAGLASQKFFQKPSAPAIVASPTTLPDVGQIVTVDLGNSGKVQSLVSLFGEARVSWKSSRDPLIVQLPGHPAHEQLILTVQGGDGLAAIVATHEAVPSLLRRLPLLRETLRSLWESGFVFWVHDNSAVAKSG